MSGHDSTWEHYTERALHHLRMQWSEHGVDYLYPGLPPDPLQPPNAHGPDHAGPTLPSGQPHPGTPVYNTGSEKPDDDFAHWHAIDEQLVRLFRHEFRSGNLDKSRDAFDVLGQAPLGTSLDEPNLEHPSEKELGDGASDRLHNLEIGLDEWHGTACENYLHHNVDLRRALAGCQDRITAAWRLMGEYRRAVRHVRHDVKDLVDKANASFDEIKEVDKRSGLTALNTVAATSTAALAIPVAGGAAAAAVAVVGVANALAGGAISNEVVRVGADKPGAVVHHVVKGGFRIVEDAHEIAERLQGACHALLETLNPPYLDVATAPDRNGVRATRPDIVADDRFNPGQFRPSGWSDAQVAGIGRGDLIAGHQSRHSSA